MVLHETFFSEFGPKGEFMFAVYDLVENVRKSKTKVKRHKSVSSVTL